ncbi:hypothetical protein [Ilumatobacter sp.]|jgi:hypothetical protein|uniref:hypothetical protein n=1 Tax=Ilumatobacter sp. TaxID=1967498 RepID=UPI003752EBFE
MKRFIQAWVVWSLIWLVLLAVAYLLSHGEPVCEGPLILATDDSFPPQCDDPSAALPTVGLLLYAIGFFPSMLLAGILQARDSRRATSN